MTDTSTADTTTAGTADTDAGSTRQRILDVATDLFISQGYDGTSLREIAEQVGVTKAALYYHFASKAEIVAAILEPFDDIQREWVADLPAAPTDEEWADALGGVIDWMVDNRRLFQLFERNHEVFEHLHDDDDGPHSQMHDTISTILGNPAIEPKRRIRMAAAMGVSFAMAPMGDALSTDLDPVEIRTELRAAVRRALDI